MRWICWQVGLLSHWHGGNRLPPHPIAHVEIRFPNRKKARAGLASNSNENFLAPAGKLNQFAELCLGFPQCGNHVTNVVLSARDVKSER